MESVDFTECVVADVDVRMVGCDGLVSGVASDDDFGEGVVVGAGGEEVLGLVVSVGDREPDVEGNDGEVARAGFVAEGEDEATDAGAVGVGRSGVYHVVAYIVSEGSGAWVAFNIKVAVPGAPSQWLNFVAAVHPGSALG